MPAVDLDTLLEPIPGENPSGMDLRYEGVYDRIQEARREDDDLNKGVWTTAIVKKADWHLVESLCAEALSTRTKDLQIAIWLMEAWINLQGVAGLKKGLELIDGMSEMYWDTLYPSLDPEDPDYRIAPFRWMNEKLSLSLKQLRVTSPDSADSVSYRWIDWENARHLELQAMKNPLLMDDIPETQVTTAHFNTSVIMTAPAFFRELHTDVSESIAVLSRMEDRLDGLLGRDAPSFRQFRDVLKDIVLLVEDILRRLGEDPMSINNGTVDAAAETDEAQAMGGGMMVAAGGDGQPAMEGAGAGGVPAIRNRADAYRVLSMVAEYLMRIEPHSPAPYLIKRAISWGSMPLGTLLQELLDGNSDLASLYKLLGIRDMTTQDSNDGW
jgi:type VI secretion system ImpA family protein